MTDNATTLTRQRQIWGSNEFSQFQLPPSWLCAGLPERRAKDFVTSPSFTGTLSDAFIVFSNRDDRPCRCYSIIDRDVRELVWSEQDYLDLFIVDLRFNISAYVEYWEDVGLLVFSPEWQSVMAAGIPPEFPAEFERYWLDACAHSDAASYVAKLRSLVNFPHPLPGPRCEAPRAGRG